MSAADETRIGSSSHSEPAGLPEFCVHWAGESVIPEEESVTHVLVGGTSGADRSVMRVGRRAVMTFVAVGSVIVGVLAGTAPPASDDSEATAVTDLVEPPASGSGDAEPSSAKRSSANGHRQVVSTTLPSSGKTILPPEKGVEDAAGADFAGSETFNPLERLALEKLVQGQCTAATASYIQLARSRQSGAGIREMARLVEEVFCNGRGDRP